MVSSPPHENRGGGGGGGLQGQWVICLFKWTMGGLLHIEGVTIRYFLPNWQTQDMNLTNCHRDVCRTKFYQIVTSDILTSL